MNGLGLDPSTAFADSALWSILPELHRAGEAERRRLLRPHEDKDTAERPVADLRDRLDRALDALTGVEIWLQCSGSAATPLAALPQAEAVLALAGSDSFLRYMNAYLYFGVRMLLRRYFVPGAVVYNDGADFTINREPWWLAVPPPLGSDCAGRIRAQVEPVVDSVDVQAALCFLDGMVPVALRPFRGEGSLSQILELWVRGLQPELAGTAAGLHLQQIVRGLTEWARRQAIVYLRLTPTLYDDVHPLQSRPDKGWRCDTPVIARAALGDLYWIAGLLRTDVTAAATVTNRAPSWLGLLRFRAALFGSAQEQQDLQATEEILREVFGAGCDLVQNSYEVACLEQQHLLQAASGQRSATTAAAASAGEGWRAVFDAELRTISGQRSYREYGDGELPNEIDVPAAKGWSRHLYTGETVPDLVGLAFSGGGIRSATFNLGVLQGLQELDLLRQVDYLSTVSGGGFAGSWLMGNVRRSTYWLGRLTPWGESINHLRKFSNYLAPRTGLLSMDTWSLGALWLRNTLLIQWTALAWLLLLFCMVYLLRLGFLGLAHTAAVSAVSGLRAVPLALRVVLVGSRGLLALLAAVVVVELSVNLCGETCQPISSGLLQATHMRGRLRRYARLLQRGYIVALAVIPAWIGAALLATQLFAAAWQGQCTGLLPGPGWLTNTAAHCVARGVAPHFSTEFLAVFSASPAAHTQQAVLLCTFAGLLVLSLASLLQSRTRRSGQRVTRVGAAFGIATVCTLLVHVCLSAISLLMQLEIGELGSLDRVAILTAVAAPGAVLLTYALAILLLIGLSGRASDDAQREWWTRYGSWVLGCAAVGLLVPLVVFGSPWFFHWLHHHHRWFKWGTVLGWAATSLGGLLAGRSSRTVGEGATRTPSLQMLANVGGGLFLLGAAMGAAELLYLFFRTQAAGTGLGVLGLEAMPALRLLVVSAAALLALALLFSWRFDLNVFGLSELYRNRLVRCYLGATRWQQGVRHPESFTQFDFNDDFKLGELSGKGFRGPFPLLNCSLNLAGSSDLSLHTRHSASFTLSPLFCGAARDLVGYRSTDHFAGNMMLGQAVAVSGAAASPNMGYNTAPLVALLLTLFNVRLGWWFPNPGSAHANHSGPSGLFYLLLELLGLASERRAYVNVTDGGHFENLGIYELVRRRSQLIIACDAECDESMTFTGLANAIRLCATDFGAQIELDLASLRRGDDGLSRTHSAVGLVRYSNGSVGRIVYLKASLTGDEDATVAQYASSHPTFPHETTANQFFKEEQFESYRRLGHHVLRTALRNIAVREPLIRAAERLMDTMTPAASTAAKFLEHTRALEQLWQQFRVNHPLQLERGGFLMELMGLAPPPNPGVPIDADVTAICLEMLQLMENTFLDLRLDDFWEHPDHRGWALLFMGWARSPRFRAVWAGNHRTFGIRFEHFCATRLGLSKDTPVLRVAPLTRD